MMTAGSATGVGSASAGARASVSPDPKKRDLPLSAYLFLLALSVLLPALLVSALILTQFDAFQRQRSEETAQLMVRGVATALERDFAGSIETLTALSSSPRRLSGDLQGFYEQAVAAMQARQLQILYRALDGSQLLNTRVPWGTALQPIPLSDIELVGTRAGQPVISDLFFGPVAKKWVYGVEIPVATNGAITHNLTMSTDVEHVERLLLDSRRSDDWIITVLDRKGTVVSRVPDHAKHVGQNRLPELEELGQDKNGVVRSLSAGEPRIVAHERLDGSNWTVIAAIPTAVIDGPWLRIWWVFSLVGVALAALCVPLAFTVSRRVTDPIKAASELAERVGHGETVNPVHTPLREANELSHALVVASKELQARAQSLARSEMRFRSVFEQAAVGFEQTTLDGRFLNINDRLCTMLGYTREECEEQSFESLTHPEDWPVEKALITKLVNGELKSYDLEKRLITKSGNPIWVRLNTSLVRDANGSLLYRTAVVEDITERRQAAGNAARLAAIVQSSADAQISVSLTGIIETWNPGAEQIFGIDAAAAIDQPLESLCPEDLKKQQRDQLRQALTGSSFHLETQRLRKDGSKVDVTIRCAAIAGGAGATAIAVTMTDISERKRSERQIAVLNQELVHRVKNSLAVIQSIANQTMRASPNPEAFRIAFQGRLRALSSANDILMQTSWNGAEIEEFLSRTLAPLMSGAGTRLTKSGPSVRIPAETGMALGLALHELGTNAIKYGSWSLPEGHVDIKWQLISGADDPAGSAPRHLRLVWSEHGGPVVTAPTRAGFGSTLIERGIPDAKVTRRFDPAGVVCEIELPLGTQMMGS
jgi:PAS domain S-box-containing protein